jgi:asparagine synthase (glutamine-hydrolysing)
MAHTIEARSPFLDKDVIKYANNLSETHFFQNNSGKQILRETFKDKLPSQIISREKVSFDVGSGIRNVVVTYLKNKKGFVSEKEELKQIWDKYFKNNYEGLYNKEYFHSYPSFNKVIEKRK